MAERLGGGNGAGRRSEDAALVVNEHNTIRQRMIVVDFEIVIGLEIHAQLLTATKLFCGCPSQFGAPPNTNGCPVCLGMPGSLPVLNRRAVSMAVRMGCAIGSTIAERSVFTRKNYFYPDLPKGYQISQYDRPLCSGGTVPVIVGGRKKNIGVTRIHLEEDAGKLIHDQASESLLDINRCGIPLIEIVSEPDMESPAEAYAYLTEVKSILEYLEICDCNMEEGSLRCDANISLRPRGTRALGTKTEIKNMNSFRGVEKALDYEARRQETVLCNGGTIVPETFLWNAHLDSSVPMRSKEDAHDYRYFPEPDLLPVIISHEEVASVRAVLPELPMEKVARFISNFDLPDSSAEVLVADRKCADYFEETYTLYKKDARQIANWITGDIFRILREAKLGFDQLKITPLRLAALLRLIDNGTVSARSGRKIAGLIQELDQDPERILREERMEQISDAEILEQVVAAVIGRYPKEAERLRAGETKLIGFFVGQAMTATKGNGNPKELYTLFEKWVNAS